MGVTASSFGFFDYQTGDPDTYQYTSAEFSKFITTICGNGVAYSYGGKFTLTTTSGSHNVSVTSGMACLNGRWGFFDSTSSITIPSTASTTFYVYIHFDIANRTVSMEVSSTAPVSSTDVALWTVTTDASGYPSTKTSQRSYFYSNTNASSSIVFSATQPAAQTGRIWLKPIS